MKYGVGKRGTNAQGILEANLEGLGMGRMQGEEESEGLGGLGVVDQGELALVQEVCVGCIHGYVCKWGARGK